MDQLKYAIIHNELTIVETFLNHIKEEDLRDQTLLFCTCLYGRSECLKLLLMKNMKPTIDCLMIASKYGRYKCIDILLNYDLDINEVIAFLNQSINICEQINDRGSIELYKETIKYLKTKL